MREFAQSSSSEDMSSCESNIQVSKPGLYPELIAKYIYKLLASPYERPNGPEHYMGKPEHRNNSGRYQKKVLSHHIFRCRIFTPIFEYLFLTSLGSGGTP